MKKNAHYQTLEYEKVCKLIEGWQKTSPLPLRILDFGCGHGKYLRALANMGCQVAGVDTNQNYIREAQSEGFVCHSDEAFLSETREIFDVILLSHLIEHLTPEQLINLIPGLCSRLGARGRLIIITPVPGERFFHDFSHVRPYLPQSIRHAFGQAGAPLSFGERKLITLTEIYFFKDPYKTRLWQSFYVGKGSLRHSLTFILNAAFNTLWRLSGGRIGVTASWLGVYELGTTH